MPGETTEPQPATDLPRGGDHRETPPRKRTREQPRVTRQPPRDQPPSLRSCPAPSCSRHNSKRWPRRAAGPASRPGCYSRPWTCSMDASAPYLNSRCSSSSPGCPQSWEQVAYVAVTHVYRDPGFARRVHERIAAPGFSKTTSSGTCSSSKNSSPVRTPTTLVPQAILPLPLSPYPPAEHPGWEPEPFVRRSPTTAGVSIGFEPTFRQIGHDERVHKQESLAQATASRFR